MVLTGAFVPVRGKLSVFVSKHGAKPMSPKNEIDFGRQLFSVPEAAEHLRVSRTMIFKLLREGKLAPTKIGSRTLISGAAIAHLLDESTSDSRETVTSNRSGS